MVVKEALLRRRRPLSGADLSPSVHPPSRRGSFFAQKPEAARRLIARGAAPSVGRAVHLEESTVRMPEVVNSDAKIIPQPVTYAVTYSAEKPL